LLSTADGSVGWCLANSAPHGATAAYVREDVAWDIFGRDPGAVLSLTLTPPGRAVIVEGGYQVTARWRFASGCRFATWHSGLCALFDGETPMLRADGSPLERFMLVPVAERSLVDTWQVIGMRGTGSHDVVVTDVFVPAYHSYTWEHADHQRYPGAYYHLWIQLGPPFLAAVPLGMARAAIDAYIDLARVKRRQYSSVLLCDHAVVQTQVGRAEALLRAARAFLWESVRAVWETAGQEGSISDEQRTVLQLCAAHAAATAIQVVDMIWDVAGATALVASSPLERLFRDIHTVQQNIFLGSNNFETAGGAFLRRAET